MENAYYIVLYKLTITLWNLYSKGIGMVLFAGI
jgi:hypothetical protein